MAYWIKDLNQSLKRYDSCLFAQETKIGRYDIYRKSLYGEHPPHFLFSLTDTWLPQGQPVSYGTEVVLNRIKAHDLWRDDTFIERWISDHEKHLESKERATRNSIESFLYDFKSQFQKATDSVNTSNLKKLYREEGSNGYRQSGS